MSRQSLHDSNLSQSSIINNQFVCPFLFTGRRYDTETGLYYYRARYYNPSIGRFLQTDPIGYGDGMNMYGYCANNPLRYMDPMGTDHSDSPAGPMWRFTDPSGNKIIIWPTHNIMILPYMLDPQVLSDYRHLGRSYWGAAKFLGLKLGSVINYVSPDLIQSMGVAAQAQASAPILYLALLGQMVEALPGLAAQNQNLWRGFFEVFEGKKDVEGNVTFKRYWIEVCGVRSGLSGDKGYRDIGYWRELDAYWATVRAMNFYVEWLYGANVPGAWIDPTYGGSMIYFGAYEFENHENNVQLATCPGPPDWDQGNRILRKSHVFPGKGVARYPE